MRLVKWNYASMKQEYNNQNKIIKGVCNNISYKINDFMNTKAIKTSVYKCII